MFYSDCSYDNKFDGNCSMDELVRFYLLTIELKSNSPMIVGLNKAVLRQLYYMSQVNYFPSQRLIS